MKNTLLEDFVKIYNYLDCKGVKFSCHKCPNRELCDLLEKVIISIEGFYQEC